MKHAAVLDSTLLRPAPGFVPHPPESHPLPSWPGLTRPSRSESAALHTTGITGTSPVMTTEGNIRLGTEDEVAVEDDLVRPPIK
ncbi:hypothetical protein J4G37_09000 [Microvirga sp. 3-52]|nr:hypothetical protein [Microvirga sp. 3-52]